MKSLLTVTTLVLVISSTSFACVGKFTKKGIRTAGGKSSVISTTASTQASVFSSKTSALK